MTEIKLNIDPNELRSIYYENDSQKYFFGPKTKKQSLYLVISLFVYPFFAWFSINQENDWIFIFGTIFFFLFLYSFMRVAKPIILWKKSVELYISKAEKTNSFKILYDEKSFWYIQDLIETKVAWTTIKNAVVNTKLICLYTNETNFILSKNSMKEIEYSAFSKVVMQKVEHIVQAID